MKRIGTTILAAVMVVAGAALAQTAKRQEIDLQAAIRTETVHGDLNGAIKQYNAIVSKFGKSDRSVAARALVRMGQCYEKLGDAESRKAYERVVREFGDQQEAVAEARRHLAKGGSEESGVVSRLLASEKGVRYGAAVSRDGRYLASILPGMSDEESRIRLHDLKTGEVRNVVTCSASEGRLDSPIISPDGKLIAYGKSPQGQSRHEIHVVGTDGSAPRFLSSGAAHAWSPDGKNLLAVIRRGKGPERALLPVSGGEPVVFGSGALEAGRFSPDGERIAFAKWRGEDWTASDIYMQAVKGGPEVPVVENAGLATSPVFSPDGKHLLLLSDRASSQDLWSVPLVSGKPSGTPVLRKQQLHTLLGLSDAGDCYYTTSFIDFTLYAAGFDTQTGKLSARPKPITESYANIGGAWSPDGQYLAYSSQVGVLPKIEMKLVVRSTKTGEERRWTAREAVKGLLPYWWGWGLQWFPDSRSLLLGTLEGGLYRVDVRTFEARPLLGGQIVLPSGNGATRTAALSPDGNTIYYWEREAKAQDTMVLQRDLQGGEPREICRLSREIGGPLSISRDGTRLLFPAVTTSSASGEHSFAIMTVAVGGGEPKELYRTTGPAIKFVIWSADGRWVLFSRQRGDVYSLPAEGGEPQALGIGKMAWPYVTRMHPDGKQFLLTDEDGGRQLWVMKNLFGEMKAAQ
ncbi:MAG: PD40 domain-containing protein [Acidobacteria bacterium]|nr:PD40 domain-containing protein [Acidobacteriota bacterium]